MPSCSIRIFKTVHNKSDNMIPFVRFDAPNYGENFTSFLRQFGGGFGDQSNQYFELDSFTNCQFVKNTLNGYVDVDMHTTSASVTRLEKQYNYMIIYYDAGSPIYCFIDHMEYVNPNSVRIHYTTDTILTYRDNLVVGGTVDRLSLPTDYTLGNRRDDNFDLYNQPEPFSISEYMVSEIKPNASDTFFHTNVPINNGDSLYTYEIIVEYNGASLPYIASSTFTTVTYYACDNYFSAYRYITTGLEFANINKIYMCPSCCVEHASQVEQGVYLVANLRYNRIWEYMRVGDFLSRCNLDGYIPKNKKLYLHPYTFSLISTPDNSMVIKNEHWTGHLQVTASGVFPPEMSLRPRGYRGTFQANSDLEVLYADNRERLLLNNYPMGNVQTTAYDQWLSQSAVPRLASFAVSAGVDIATDNVGGLAKEVAGLGLEVLATKSQPNLSTGGFISTSDDTESGYKKFQYSLLTIPKSQCRQIDHYLTDYGYSLNGLVVRNINLRARKYFTYVKMRRCELQFRIARGNSTGVYDYTPYAISNDEADDIRRRFERGVRLWQTVDLTDVARDFLLGIQIDNSVL